MLIFVLCKNLTMEAKYNYTQEYTCPCGKRLKAEMLYENNNEHIIDCSCGAQWIFTPFSIEKKPEVEGFPKIIDGTKKTVLINQRKLSKKVKDEVARIEKEYIWKPVYEISGKTFKTYVSSHYFDSDGFLSTVEINFHYGDKLDRLNVKITCSTENTDDDIIKELQVYEKHIQHYIKEGKLTDEYKFEHFRSYEVEELVSIENWM